MRAFLIAVLGIVAFAVSATLNYASEPKPGQQEAQGYDLTGRWTGYGWGEVNLKDTKEGYVGTFTDTYDGKLGSVTFTRSGPGTYTGLFWNANLRRYGSVELHVAEDGLSIAAAWKGLDDNYRSSRRESTWKRVVANSPKDDKGTKSVGPALAGVEEEDDGPWPCIVLGYYSGMTIPAPPGTVMPPSAAPEGGLRMAIWEDGSILIQPDRSISEHILIGSLDGDDLETALQSIVQTGLFSGSREGYVVPDAGYSTLMVRTKTESKVRSWHGKLSPGFGGNLNTDGEYREFVKRWKASEATLLALTPVKVERLAGHLKRSGATRFRGYNPQKPFEAPWMHKRNWRDRPATSERLKTRSDREVLTSLQDGKVIKPEGPPSAPSVEDLLQAPPIVALWKKSDHLRSRSTAPNLRIAIWNDGRVLSAQDPSKWGHQLELGRLADDTLSELKKQILDTGVLDLKGHCYLVPSAPVYCLLVRLDGKEQLLYWDERESPHYGINTNPKPHHLAFKKAWKSVNELAVSAIPDDSVPVLERFEAAPKSWYVKPAIQSE